VRVHEAAVAVLVSLSTADCRPPATATTCSTRADCAPGWRCDETRKFCYPFSDAAVGDAGPADRPRADLVQRDHIGTDHRNDDRTATDRSGDDRTGFDRDGGARDQTGGDSADSGARHDATSQDGPPVDAAGRERSPGDAIGLDQHQPDSFGRDVIAEGCLIGGNVTRTGAVNPDEPCQYCDPRRALIGWTTRSDSEFCDDGDGCTIDDSCLGGTCQAGGTYCVGRCDPVLKACCGAFGEAPCTDGGCYVSGSPVAFDGGTLCAESCGQFNTGCCGGMCLPGLGCFYDECILCGTGNDRGCTDIGPFCGDGEVLADNACVTCGIENYPCCPGTTCPADPLLSCCNRGHPPGVCLYYACTR
jgi:hypothetical protein